MTVGECRIAYPTMLKDGGRISYENSQVDRNEECMPQRVL